MELLILHGHCDKSIWRTCRRFNENYGDLGPIKEKKMYDYKGMSAIMVQNW